jgi:hypothetical protein
VVLAWPCSVISISRGCGSNYCWFSQRYELRSACLDKKISTKCQIVEDAQIFQIHKSHSALKISEVKSDIWKDRRNALAFDNDCRSRELFLVMRIRFVLVSLAWLHFSFYCNEWGYWRLDIFIYRDRKLVNDKKSVWWGLDSEICEFDLLGCHNNDNDWLRGFIPLNSDWTTLWYCIFVDCLWRIFIYNGYHWECLTADWSKKVRI